MKNLLFLSESKLEDLSTSLQPFLQIAEDANQILTEGILDEEWKMPAAWVLVSSEKKEQFFKTYSYPVWSTEASIEFQLESKIPRYGIEVDEKTIPPQVGYGDNYFSYTKGCYVGQEIISRLKHYGKK